LRVMQIWKEVLGLDDINPGSGFFELGGHSLVAVRLMARINAGFGMHLPLATLFQHPTLESFAAFIRQDARDAGRWPELILMNRGDDPGQAVILIPGAGGNVLYFQALAAALETSVPVFGAQP